MLYIDSNDEDPFGLTLVTAVAAGEESHDGCDDGNACVLPGDGDEGGDGDDEGENDDDDDGNGRKGRGGRKGRDDN